MAISTFSGQGIYWQSYLEKTDNWQKIYKQISSTFCTSNDVYLQTMCQEEQNH